MSDNMTVSDSACHGMSDTCSVSDDPFLNVLYPVIMTSAHVFRPFLSTTPAPSSVLSPSTDSPFVTLNTTVRVRLPVVTGSQGSYEWLWAPCDVLFVSPEASHVDVALVKIATGVDVSLSVVQVETQVEKFRMGEEVAALGYHLFQPSPGRGFVTTIVLPPSALPPILPFPFPFSPSLRRLRLSSPSPLTRFTFVLTAISTNCSIGILSKVGYVDAKPGQFISFFLLSLLFLCFLYFVAQRCLAVQELCTGVQVAVR